MPNFEINFTKLRVPTKRKCVPMETTKLSNFRPQNFIRVLPDGWSIHKHQRQTTMVMVTFPSFRGDEFHGNNLHYSTTTTNLPWGQAVSLIWWFQMMMNLWNYSINLYCSAALTDWPLQINLHQKQPTQKNLVVNLRLYKSRFSIINIRFSVINIHFSFHIETMEIKKW